MFVGWEPWSSGYGRWLMFQRSWVQIPAPYTGWTWHFSALIRCQNVIVCLKRSKINEKEAGVGPFLQKIPDRRSRQMKLNKNLLMTSLPAESCSRPFPVVSFNKRIGQKVVSVCWSIAVASKVCDRGVLKLVRRISRLTQN